MSSPENRKDARPEQKLNPERAIHCEPCEVNCVLAPIQRASVVSNCPLYLESDAPWPSSRMCSICRTIGPAHCNTKRAL